MRAQLSKPKCPKCRAGVIPGQAKIGGPPTFCDCERGQQARNWYLRDQGQRVELVKATNAANLEQSLVLPYGMRDWTFATSPMRGNETARKVLEKVERFFQTWDWRTGLILYGSYGRGKTGLLVSGIKGMRDRAINEGWGIRWTTSMDMFADLQAGFKDEQRGYAQRLEKYQQPHVLAIDELGNHRPTEFRNDVYDAILSARYDQRRPLFATTNLSKEALLEELGERLFWRLWEQCKFVCVRGEDFRAVAQDLDDEEDDA